MSKDSKLVVSLCCNNPNTGMFEGEVCAIHIAELEIEGAEFERDGVKGAPMRYLKDGWAPRPQQVEILGRAFPITDYRYGYGNWCWDGVEVTAETAIELLNFLMTNTEWHFGIEAGPTELFDAWRRKEPFTEKHIPLLVEISEEADDDFHHFMR